MYQKTHVHKKYLLLCYLFTASNENVEWHKYPMIA